MELQKITARLDPDLVARLDQWRRTVPEDVPSRSEAVRRLVEKGVEGIVVPRKLTKKP
jgi:metal-responsive CopG/Arc/MetJ family transcriptional regulator